jgi:3-methyl-2-oxobutanoate hydroxymethyltransferase
VHFKKEARAMSTTIHDLRGWKQAGKRFVMLTAYDYPTARILDEAGIPVLLVGDSVGNNVLGYETTLPVTMQDMLHHTKAVARGVRTAMVVGDMPFGSYQVSVGDGVRNAARFLQEGGAHAVKIEGAEVELIHRLVDLGIPVMAHVGLTPQSVHGMGGYRVQGRGEEAAAKLLEQAHALEKAGAFAIVLEGMPADVGSSITSELHIPTIGIGAGSGTDAQVLVINDLLGLSEHEPRFAKAYADLRGVIAGAVTAFASDVELGTFPDAEHSYS